MGKKDENTEVDETAMESETEDGTPATGESDEKLVPRSILQKVERQLKEANRKSGEFERKLKAIEDKDKSDSEKASERLAELEQSKARSDREAAQLRVAIKKGLTLTQAKRLIGETDEELEADADDLLESFGKGKSTEGDEADEKLDERPDRTRPKERLKSGAANTESEAEETDPSKLAATVPRL